MSSPRRRSMDDLHIATTTRRENAHADRIVSTRSTSAPRERPQLRQLRSSLLPGRASGRLVPLGPAWDENHIFSSDSYSIPASLSDLGGGSTGVHDHSSVVGTTTPSNEPPPTLFQGPGLSVRVRCYCVGGSFDRAKLQDTILRRSSSSSVRAYPDVLCSTFSTSITRLGARAPLGDILFFDWGSVVFWGLDTSAERHILREIAEPCLENPLHIAYQERDRIAVTYSTSPRTVIEDDALALHYKFVDNMEVKLAVSFALAQSTKLVVYEEELRRLVKRLSNLPGDLAELGEVPMSERDVMRTIGVLYKQMAAVNLLGAALDVPDAMGSAQSNIRSLYKSVYDYLEVADRLTLLNDRFGVVREMLELCRTLRHESQSAWIESVIMILVGITAVLALVQLFGFLGWTPSWRGDSADGGHSPPSPPPPLVTNFL